LSKAKPARKSRLSRFACNNQKTLCHSECSEESSPSNPILEDPSQDRLRMTKEYSIITQRRLGTTGEDSGH
jgi:hypothetical protein